MSGIPSQFDRAMAMWREIDFPLIDEKNQALRFLEDLSEMYSNGNVIHKSFAIPDHPDLDAFINAGALHSTYFFERFWKTKSVALAFPHTLHDVKFLAPDTFRFIHPVELSGTLARTLLNGGAYTTERMSARTAMVIADEAAELLVGGDFDGPSAFFSHLPWSTFFYDVAWDYTWIIVRPRDRRIEVIVATDTD